VQKINIMTGFLLTCGSQDDVLTPEFVGSKECCYFVPVFQKGYKFCQIHSVLEEKARINL
jgi:hypothetical protein